MLEAVFALILSYQYYKGIMKKIELVIGDQVQGNFEKKKLNLLLVFQVNCPGCFAYALPLFNKLYHKFDSRSISFLAMSAAFEDFDKNTLENTEALLKEGRVVGETKKMLFEHGYDTFPYVIDFPVAMDMIKNNFDNLDEASDKICRTNPNYNSWNDPEKEVLRQRVKGYLKSLDKVGFTFTLNQLRGTPSFILFNADNEILEQWFGHVSQEIIEQKIAQYH